MKVLWAALFLASDVIVASSLIALLCCREFSVPRSIEWMFPLRGKWLWRFLIALVIVAYISLAPVGLFTLIRIVKHH